MIKSIATSCAFQETDKTLTLNMLHIGIHQRFNLNFFWSNLSLF